MVSRKCQLLVAASGRLGDILERDSLSLPRNRYLILDEADGMLNMGFEPPICRIIQGKDMSPPGQRQTLMFPTTFPNFIQILASELLLNYVFFAVGSVGTASEILLKIYCKLFNITIILIIISKKNTYMY